MHLEIFFSVIPVAQVKYKTLRASAVARDCTLIEMLLQCRCTRSGKHH